LSIFILPSKNSIIMKKYALLTLLIFTCALLYDAEAQIDLRKKIKKETVKRADKRTDQGINKGLDEVEEGVGDLFNKDDKDEKSDYDKSSENISSKDNTGQNNQQESEQETTSGTAVLKWSKYDFVPGDKVIFEDIQDDEENGEFPSRWDLVQGVAENAEFNGNNVIYFRQASTAIIPYIKNRDQDYLPEKFTVEFDCYFETKEYASYYITLYDTKNQKNIKLDPIRVGANGINCGNHFKGLYPGTDNEFNSNNNMWRHVSVSFNRRALKVYLDDTRILNIPNIEADPSGVTIRIDNFGVVGVKGINRFIKNIRIAEGAVKLYDKLQQDGKIVSNGIRFDVGKATIKPESMGVLNKISELMNEHPEIKFSIEGHTDSDGDEDFNMELSKQRADAVVSTLVEMGIDKERLISKGYGETVPVDSNTTPEGKANNRRVEFVKI
jgi:OOP family OmpA-OmpF porin